MENQIKLENDTTEVFLTKNQINLNQHPKMQSARCKEKGAGMGAVCVCVGGGGGGGVTDKMVSRFVGLTSWDVLLHRLCLNPWSRQG